MTGPSGRSAGGTRVVLPAPGAAVITAARDRRTRSTIWSRNGSIGSGIRTRPCVQPSRSRRRRDPDRAAHAGAAQAAIAVGVLREVLLVIVLGVVERGLRQNLR